MNPGGEVEPRDIETFVVLGEELHFGRTADRLHVSPTAISKTIKKLERMVGAKLFERTTHRVDLTPIGRRLYDNVAPAYQQIQAGFDDAVLAGRGVAGLLRVGFLGTIGQFVLKVADAFQTAYPACQVQIKETRFDDVGAELTGGMIDILVASYPALDPEIAAGPVLFSEGSVLAVSARHPFARRASVTIEDLGRDKVLRPRGIPDELYELRVPRETPGGRPIERGPDFGTLQEMFALVGAGKGIFLLSEHSNRYGARPDVVFIPIDDGPRFEWRLLWRKAAETHRIRAFSQIAEDCVRQDGMFLL